VPGCVKTFEHKLIVSDISGRKVTIYSPSVVFERRESKSRKNVGIVTVRTMNLNQRGVADISFWRIAGIDQRHEGRSVRDKGRTEDGL